MLNHSVIEDCNEFFSRIYLLIRPKKGILPADRLNVILDTPIFHDWKINKPHTVAKLFPIAGDIMEPNLGLSEEDIETVTEHVSIVFHSAASVRFDEPIERYLYFCFKKDSTQFDQRGSYTKLLRRS